MAFFSSFTDSIKQKWLQFFQSNRDWIKLHMEAESVYTPDGGKRPSSYLILGVVNALEPKLAQLMFPFSKLNPDADILIEVLDLHFDPDIALGNLVIPQAEPEIHQYKPASVVDESSEDETLAISHKNGFTNGFGGRAIAQEQPKESHHGLDDIYLSNGHNSENEFHQLPIIELDNFGGVSFDAASAPEEKLDDELNIPDENAFSDVLSDVWGDETALQKDDENNDFLGEDLPSGVFDESEIARLFPNA